MTRAFLAAAFPAFLVFLAAAPAGAGRLEGRVVLGVDLRLEDVAPVIVFVDSLDDRPVPAKPRKPATIRQHEARFEPSLLVVARGQSVAMPNDDLIFHNVFSFSEPNDFDLGLYPMGESRTVRFGHPGVVRLYCSIHESMNATVVVSPTPWFAQVDRDGRFAISGVPAGRWRIRAWAEALPEGEAIAEIAGGTTRVEITLAPADPPTPAAPRDR